MTAGGVGYKMFLSPAAAELCTVGKTVTVETYLVVKEDALDLFAFGGLPEKNLFKLLISVSGVGPKTALNILALGSAADISSAVARGDVSYLTKVSGIGKKIAERLVMELREKIGALTLGGGKGQPGAVGDGLSDVVEALESLGYSSQQARDTVKMLDAKGKNSEQLLREALRMIK